MKTWWQPSSATCGMLKRASHAKLIMTRCVSMRSSLEPYSSWRALNMSRETELQFVFLEGGAVQARTVNISEMIIAGWTGRDSQSGRATHRRT